MSVVSPPPQDELELLIREARARQRKRWLGAAVAVAVLAGGALAVFSIAGGGSRSASSAGGGPAAVRVTRTCGIRVAGPRILGADGRAVYREPVPRGEVHPNFIPSQVRCSGSAIWVVWFNGAGMMHEDYVGARSLDRGRTWHVVFAQQPGVHSRALDAEIGPWTLGGPRAAYVVGTCPACWGFGTVSLSVTRDAGHTFRMYRVPGSDRWMPSSIRVRGRQVTIRERRDLGLRSRWRTVIVHTA